MKLLFLDIDGVIATHKSNYCLDPEKMELLGQTLGRTGAFIVISSSWRQTTLYDTKKVLEDGKIDEDTFSTAIQEYNNRRDVVLLEL